MVGNRNLAAGTGWCCEWKIFRALSKPSGNQGCVFAMKWKPVREAGKFSWKILTATLSNCSSRATNPDKPDLNLPCRQDKCGRLTLSQIFNNSCGEVRILHLVMFES